MFESKMDVVSPGQINQYQLVDDGRALSFQDTIKLWQENEAFRSFFTTLLKESEFESFRWETPGLRLENASQRFQFVLLNSPGFVRRSTDYETFQPFYEADKSDSGILAFKNLGKDATLIVPAPRTDQDAYGHLADFVRLAPSTQVDQLWKTVGESVSTRIGDQPLWLSTAGGGVAWLHVRIDDRPKYYGYAPFRSP